MLYILIIYYCVGIIFFILNDLMTLGKTSINENLDNSLFSNLLESEL